MPKILYDLSNNSNFNNYQKINFIKDNLNTLEISIPNKSVQMLILNYIENYQDIKFQKKINLLFL